MTGTDAVNPTLGAQVLSDLIALVAIPSVSALDGHRADVARAAEWLKRRLERMGVPRVEILLTGGHPVVYGEVGDPKAPTVLIYGHYDVQPADPLDLWHSPPFEATVREGRVYGRGTSDDKGPLLIALAGVERLLSEGSLPGVRLKFLLEGEEEIGSPNLPPFLARERDRLSADLVISADGGMWRSTEPSLNVAAKGLVNLEVEIVTAASDLHSGRHGGAIPNALHVLSHLVESFHNEGGDVAVEGFYDHVVEPPPALRNELAQLPFDEEAYRRDQGVLRLEGEAGYSTLERLWLRPTLDVTGMWGGFTAEGMKTVVPSRSTAKISCRLVPDQRPDEILERVTAHVKNCVAGRAQVNVRQFPGQALPYTWPQDHPALEVAADVLEETFRTRPFFVRMGGTLPAANLFLQELGAPTLFFSFSVSDEAYHAPNEFFRLARIDPGIQAWTNLLSRLKRSLESKQHAAGANETQRDAGSLDPGTHARSALELDEDTL